MFPHDTNSGKDVCIGERHIHYKFSFSFIFYDRGKRRVSPPKYMRKKCSPSPFEKRLVFYVENAIFFLCVCVFILFLFEMELPLHIVFMFLGFSFFSSVCVLSAAE